MIQLMINKDTNQMIKKTDKQLWDSTVCHV